MSGVYFHREYNDNRNMKKCIAVIVLILAVSTVFAGEYISSLWSVGTSALFYGDPAITDLNENLKKEDFINLVLSGEYGARIQLDERIDFIASAYLALDSYAKRTDAILRLDYGISGGVRLTPGLGGLVLGCEYCTGQRADVDSLSDDDTVWSTTQWGNGYRFLFEYDFSALTSGIAPVIGVSFRSVPRGNNCTDRNLAFYIRLME